MRQKPNRQKTSSWPLYTQHGRFSKLKKTNKPSEKGRSPQQDESLERLCQRSALVGNENQKRETEEEEVQISLSPFSFYCKSNDDQLKLCKAVELHIFGKRQVLGGNLPSIRNLFMFFLVFVFFLLVFFYVQSQSASNFQGASINFKRMHKKYYK